MQQKVRDWKPEKHSLHCFRQPLVIGSSQVTAGGERGLSTQSQATEFCNMQMRLGAHSPQSFLVTVQSHDTLSSAF